VRKVNNYDPKHFDCIECVYQPRDTGKEPCDICFPTHENPSEMISSIECVNCGCEVTWDWREGQEKRLVHENWDKKGYDDSAFSWDVKCLCGCEAPVPEIMFYPRKFKWRCSCMMENEGEYKRNDSAFMRCTQCDKIIEILASK